MFDPYHAWLGISSAEQPASHYRLLGVRDFEQDANVIANAADRQMGFVKQFATGQHAAASQQILNQLATAKICLLNAGNKAVYDAHLRAQLNGPQLPQALIPESIQATSEDNLAISLAEPSPARRTRPAKAKTSSGPNYAQVSAFVAVVLAFAGVLYAWRILDSQKQELAKAQAIIDEKGAKIAHDEHQPQQQPAPPQPAPPKQTTKRHPAPMPMTPRQQPAIANIDHPSSLMAPAAVAPGAVLDSSDTPLAPVPVVRPVLPTRESFAGKPWTIQLPNNRTLASVDLLMPAFAEKEITAKTPTYQWKSGDLDGYFKFTQVDKTLYQLNGYGVTLHNPESPRTFSKYAKNDREGRFWMLDVSGTPVLMAGYSDNKLYGVLCYCTAGVPAIIQDRRGDEVLAKYAVAVAENGLLSAVPPTDKLEGFYSSASAGLEVLLDQLDREHNERIVSFRKWVREEQEKQRRQLAGQLGVQKRQAISDRGKQQDAANDAALKKIMWGSRGY